MHQHHQPSPTTPCFRKSFSKSGQVRFDNSFVEYSSVNRADIPNQQLSLTGLKPYRLMSNQSWFVRVPQGSRNNPYSDSAAEWRSLQKIIDAHVHLSERQDDALIRFARMNGLRYTLEELLGTMERYGITRVLLFSPPLQGTVALPNDKVIALCARSGGMLAPVVTVEPTAKDVNAAVKLAEEK